MSAGLLLTGALLGIAWMFRKQSKNQKSKGKASTRLPTDSSSASQSVLKSKGDSSARWIPKGEAISVASITIPGGMVYLGTARRSDDAPRSTINPSLQVAKSAPDTQGKNMPPRRPRKPRQSTDQRSRQCASLGSDSPTRRLGRLLHRRLHRRGWVLPPGRIGVSTRT